MSGPLKSRTVLDNTIVTKGNVLNPHVPKVKQTVTMCALTPKTTVKTAALVEHSASKVKSVAMVSVRWSVPQAKRLARELVSIFKATEPTAESVILPAKMVRFAKVASA